VKKDIDYNGILLSQIVLYYYNVVPSSKWCSPWWSRKV